MSFHIGYTIPDSSTGQCFTLDDKYHGLVTDEDASHIAEGLRKHGEPHWQTVKSHLIRLAKSRRSNHD